MNPQQEEQKGLMHNVKEKIVHPMRHDTDTNITYPSKEQKHLEEHERERATDQPLGSTLAGTTGTTGTTGYTGNVPREQQFINK